MFHYWWHFQISVLVYCVALKTDQMTTLMQPNRGLTTISFFLFIRFDVPWFQITTIHFTMETKIVQSLWFWHVNGISKLNNSDFELFCSSERKWTICKVKCQNWAIIIIIIMNGKHECHTKGTLNNRWKCTKRNETLISFRIFDSHEC